MRALMKPNYHNQFTPAFAAPPRERDRDPLIS
jgi:hypothetical protein